MKREGRQHGFVRTNPNLPTHLSRQRRYVKTVDSSPVVAGLLTKVSTKPTNEPKYTGIWGQARCDGCHNHRICKYKEKAKGTMKLRSIGSDRGLFSCPAGSSAVDALAYLARYGSFDDITVDDYDYNDETNL